ncbi:unnamed protein product [Linum tenue]|uniref:DNA-directed RNA polymerase RBP11-like dimerisation domain-containing protein n=1 Tax=Linum tenue TaxID=586396 RepID=A0AAV0Q7I5_9ROSI|nr:unnamed protein product [Linum tenue]
MCVAGNRREMEHGSLNDPSKATFSFVDEDHTLANSVRFCLNQDPRVSVCGYSIPHPSDARVNIRIQTTGTTVEFPFLLRILISCQNLGGATTCLVSCYKWVCCSFPVFYLMLAQTLL